MSRISFPQLSRGAVGVVALLVPAVALAAWTDSGTVISVMQKVGIGTSSPKSLLHVHNKLAGATVSEVRVSATSSGADSGSGVLLRIDGTQGEVTNYEDDDLLFGTAGLEVMRITPDGFLGIGDSQPSAMVSIYQPSTDAGLQLEGASGALLQVGEVNCAGCFASGATEGDVVFRTLSNGSGSAPSMIFSIPTTAEVGTREVRFQDDDGVLLSIQNGGADGRVGVGTDTPAERLDVNGNIKLNGNITSDGAICIGSGC